MRYNLHRFGIAVLFYAVLFLSTAEEVRSNSKNSEFDEYVYYQGVQGRPGVDFPVFARIPRTSFSCKQVLSGYYADLETNCQVFHICNEGSKISFLCPNGTIFQQSDLICEWWFKVNCTNSPNLYEESAEQLLEENWRRKENRKAGYQNKLANEEKKNVKVDENIRRNENPRKPIQFDRKETFPGSPNKQYFQPEVKLDRNRVQNRGNRRYKNPVDLNRKNELNFDESSEESQIPAESASFYDNNNRNSIQSTTKSNLRNHNSNQRVESTIRGLNNQQRQRKLKENQKNSNLNQESIHQRGTNNYNNNQNGNYGDRKSNGEEGNYHSNVESNRESRPGNSYRNSNQNSEFNNQKFKNDYNNDSNKNKNDENLNNYDKKSNAETLSYNSNTESNRESRLGNSYKNSNHNGDFNKNIKNEYDNYSNRNKNNENLNNYNKKSNGETSNYNSNTESNRESRLDNSYTNSNQNGDFNKKSGNNYENYSNGNKNNENLNNYNEKSNGETPNYNSNAESNRESKPVNSYTNSNRNTNFNEKPTNGYESYSNQNQNDKKENRETISYNSNTESIPVNSHTNSNGHAPSYSSNTESRYVNSYTNSNQNDNFNEKTTNSYEKFSNQNQNDKKGNRKPISYNSNTESIPVNSYTNSNAQTSGYDSNTESRRVNSNQNDNFNENPTNSYENYSNQNQNDQKANRETITYNSNTESIPVNSYTNSNAQTSGYDSNTESIPVVNSYTNSNDQTSSYNSNQESITVNYYTTQAFSEPEFTTSNYEIKSRNRFNEFSNRESITTNSFINQELTPQVTSQNEGFVESTTQTYKNHKETYTEVREPKFVSTKAYSLGSQTSPPQTVSTNRIPLNDGKPFVVSTPKSSYNIKEFTTENFVYSPTVPPFTTTTKSYTTIQSETEGVVFSEPYSNVVTEKQKQKEAIHIVNSIPESKIISENNKNNTEFVRIGTKKPDKIFLTLSTNPKQKPNEIRHRYVSAVSKSDPNNACVDEIVNRKGTTKQPKIKSKKIDSKKPEVQKPRSFQIPESPIYRVDLKNQAIEKVTLKPTGFYVTKAVNDVELLDVNPSTRFGGLNTYLPKETTTKNGLNLNLNVGNDNNKNKGTPDESKFLIKSEDNVEIVQKPKPFELPPKFGNEETQNIATTEATTQQTTSPNYEVSSARPFELTPTSYEHVSNMLNSIQNLITKNNDSSSELFAPQTLHSLASYFANALSENENESTTVENDESGIELLSIPTLNRYKDLFKEETTTESSSTTENNDNDLEGQHTKNGIVTPRVRQLAQVFTKALSSYLDNPKTFKKQLEDVRPTEPTKVDENSQKSTTQRSLDNLSNNTEEDELLNYSDADIKPDLPRLSTTPSVSPTWGYIFAPNNSNNFEYNSLNTDENLQSADTQSFVSQFNSYVKEKHFGKSTTPLSTKIDDDLNKKIKDKLYDDPRSINDDLNRNATEISYELRSLPKLELNSTQIHGILIDFMNTTKSENNRLLRILNRLNTTQEEFLSKMREIEQNPLTRRLILLLISECAQNVTTNHHQNTDQEISNSNENLKKASSVIDLFKSSKLAENDKVVSKNSAIPKFVDETLKDDDEDTRALELLNSLYTIASRYGK